MGMQLIKIGVITALLLILTGCRKAMPTRVVFEGDERAEIVYVESQLGNLSSENAIHDAQVSIRNGDYRFAAVRGVVLNIPGLDLPINERRNLGYKIILGTNDMLENENHKRMVDAAYVYAKVYNIEILKSLTRYEPGT